MSGQIETSAIEGWKGWPAPEPQATTLAEVWETLAAQERERVQQELVQVCQELMWKEGRDEAA